ncbi:MAG: hypothetical protein ACREVK_03735 [Gammaproteobacteria bacterium]
MGTDLPGGPGTDAKFWEGFLEAVDKIKYGWASELSNTRLLKHA